MKVYAPETGVNTGVKQPVAFHHFEILSMTCLSSVTRARSAFVVG